jgi:hypothetical protein
LISAFEKKFRFFLPTLKANAVKQNITKIKNSSFSETYEFLFTSLRNSKRVKMKLPTTRLFDSLFVSSSFLISAPDITVKLPKMCGEIGRTSKPEQMFVMLKILYNSQKADRQSVKFCFLEAGLRIQIRIGSDSIESVDPDSESGSGSRRAKMTHKRKEKLMNLKFWMFSFES